MNQVKKAKIREKEAAQHLAAVRSYYESGDEAYLSPVFVDLNRILPAFLKSKNRHIAYDTVQDVTQISLMEILLSLRKHVFNEGGTSSFVSWAISFCWYAYVTFQYRGKNIPGEPGVDDAEDAFRRIGSFTEDPPSELNSTPEEKARASDLIEAVTEAVLKLDTNLKDAILLHFYHGLPHHVAADKLGLTTQKFMWRTTRGLNALKAWAQRQGVPSNEVLSALAWVDTGGLFREPEKAEKQEATDAEEPVDLESFNQ